MPDKKILNGREIEFSDVIHHHTETIYGWKDRIRILFGRKSITVSKIYTKERCNVVGSEASVYVSPLLRTKPKIVGLIS